MGQVLDLLRDDVPAHGSAKGLQAQTTQGGECRGRIDDSEPQPANFDDLRKKFGGGPLPSIPRTPPTLSKPQSCQEEESKEGIEDLEFSDEGSGIATLKKKFGRGSPPLVASGTLPMISKWRTHQLDSREELEVPIDNVSDWSGVWPMVLRSRVVLESRSHEMEEAQSGMEDLESSSENFADLKKRFDGSSAWPVASGTSVGVGDPDLPSDIVADLKKKFDEGLPTVIKSSKEDLELPSDYVSDLRKKFDGTSMPDQGEEPRVSLEDLELPSDYFTDLKKKFDGSSAPDREQGVKACIDDPELPADIVADLRKKFDGSPDRDDALQKSSPVDLEVQSDGAPVANIRKKFDGCSPPIVTSGFSSAVDMEDSQLPSDDFADLKKRFVGGPPLYLPIWPQPASLTPLVSKPHQGQEQRGLQYSGDLMFADSAAPPMVTNSGPHEGEEPKDLGLPAE